MNSFIEGCGFIVGFVLRYVSIGFGLTVGIGLGYATIINTVL